MLFVRIKQMYNLLTLVPNKKENKNLKPQQN